MAYGNNDYRDYLEHSAKGQKWSNHKYLYITPSGRYVYPEDLRQRSKRHGGGTSTVSEVSVYGWSRDKDGNRNGIVEIGSDTFGGSGRKLGSKNSFNKVVNSKKNEAVDKAFTSVFGKAKGSRRSVNMDVEDFREWKSKKNNGKRKKTFKKIGNSLLSASRLGNSIRNLYAYDKNKKNAERTASAQKVISEAYGLNSGAYRQAKRDKKSRKVASR